MCAVAACSLLARARSASATASAKLVVIGFSTSRWIPASRSRSPTGACIVFGVQRIATSNSPRFAAATRPSSPSSHGTPVSFANSEALPLRPATATSSAPAVSATACAWIFAMYPPPWMAKRISRLTASTSRDVVAQPAAIVAATFFSTSGCRCNFSRASTAWSIPSLPARKMFSSR